MAKDIYFEDKKVGHIALGIVKRKKKIVYDFLEPYDLIRILLSRDGELVEYVNKKPRMVSKGTIGDLKKSLRDCSVYISIKKRPIDVGEFYDEERTP